MKNEKIGYNWKKVKMERTNTSLLIMNKVEHKKYKSGQFLNESERRESKALTNGRRAAHQVLICSEFCALWKNTAQKYALRQTITKSRICLEDF